MKSLKWGATVLATLILAGALTTACRPTFVVVPYPEGESLADTVRVRDDAVVVTFRVDTLFRVDTVLRVDSLYLDGTDTVYVREVRTDTVVRVDTLVSVDSVEVAVTDTLVRTDTLVHTDTVLRVDTVAARDAMVFVDTVTLTDTLRLTVTDTVMRLHTVVRVDTMTRVDTVMRVDTVLRLDTVEVAVTDTLFRTDTVRVAGQRHLFLPPGHYPPDGQCRVWIHGVPPGRQARPAACDRLGDIPGGAFILFGGDAWDFDYDWLAEAEANPGSVPPEIVALKRRGGRAMGGALEPGG